MKNIFRNMAKKKKTKKEETAKKADQNGTTTNVKDTQVSDNEQNKAEEKNDKKDKVAELQQELSVQKDKFLRLYAEFENYKKRTLREKVELMGTAAQDTMSALLPVLDDFDRAKANASADNSAEVFSEGVQLIYNKLYKVLKQKGLTKMESNNMDFDPELHEAIAEIPAPTDEMKGKIIDTTEAGYQLKDKIIRHAKVVVGK